MYSLLSGGSLCVWYGMVVCSIFCAGRSVNKSNEMAGKHCVHDDSSYIKWLVCVVVIIWYGMVAAFSCV